MSDVLNQENKQTDYYAIAAEDSDVLEREERRATRMNDCGKFAWWFNPHTGGKSGYYRRCDIFRECDDCLERRAQKEKEYMMGAIMSKTVLITRVEDKSEGNKFVRNTKASKSEYVRYPLQDGSEIIFFDAVLGAEGTEINLQWVLDENWKEIVSQPEGRNKSGTMHVPPSPDSNEEYTMINTYQLVADAPNGTVTMAMDEVIAETSYMNPETPEEVERDVFTRFLELQRKLRDQGFKSRTYPKKTKVIHSKIDWMSDSSGKINVVNTENITLESLVSPPG